MLTLRQVYRMAPLALALLLLAACHRQPSANWYVATGRALMTDEEGQPRPRIEAVEDALMAARVDILEHVQEMEMGSRPIGDYMARQPRLDQRIRAIIIAAPQLDARYGESAVEVDVGLQLKKIRETAVQATP
jgi:hypothetical protein